MKVEWEELNAEFPLRWDKEEQFPPESLKGIDL
jgi:hypothetical protein